MSDRNSNPWLSGMEFYDPEFYQKALDTTNIWRMDYYLARVFNTPAYCNVLLQDLHGQVESKKLKTQPIFEEEYTPHTLHQTSLRITIDALLTALYDLKLSDNDKRLAIKGVAWFLITTSIIINVDLNDLPVELATEVTNLYGTLDENNPTVMFFHLIKVCGTRFSAEKARSFVSKLVQTLS